MLFHPPKNNRARNALHSVDGFGTMLPRDQATKTDRACEVLIMRNSIVAIIFAMTLGVVAVRAEDYTGKIKSLDIKKSEITVTTAEGKDMTFPIAKDVSVFYEAKPKKKGQPGGLEPVPGGLGGLKVGNPVTITTEKKNEIEVASLIKLETEPKK